MARAKHKSKQARKPQGARLKSGARKANRRSAGKAARGPSRSTRAGATEVSARPSKPGQSKRSSPVIIGRMRSNKACDATRNIATLELPRATNGMVRAHVIKMVPPCDPAEVSKRHFHEVDFQMVYVLRVGLKVNMKALAWSPCARARAGCSRRRSSMPCSIIPTIANCSKSSCRQTLRPLNWSNSISPGRLFSA